MEHVCSIHANLQQYTIKTVGDLDLFLKKEKNKNMFLAKWPKTAYDGLM